MKYMVLFLTVMCGITISGCSHISELTGDTLPANETDVDYTVTYYIHADSDYLYHTPDGEPVRENSDVLNTAFKVAEAARSGEILIFYQRSERKLLGLFPRRSSRFYHYINGRLINRVNYRHPDKKEDFLTTEVLLMNQYRTPNQAKSHQNYFLYFGHEIPSNKGKGYHRTLPGIDVNTLSFAKGVQNFLSSREDRFDLVVLSTCNNGTPIMAERLMSFTDLLLTSPQNLHLSHVDTDKITLLESEPDTSPIQLARSMVQQTYQRLAEDIQTTITLALYDLKEVRPYIKPLTSLIEANIIMDHSIQFQENVDCAELYFPDSASYRRGVEIWYKPARFGRKTGQLTHSGWGCKPVVQ